MRWRIIRGTRRQRHITHAHFPRWIPLLLPHPSIPHQPRNYGGGGGAPGDCDGRNALLVYSDKTADEDCDGADLLDDDGGVCDEGPEVVGLQAGIALEVFEEGGVVGVVIRICLGVC